MYTSDEHVSRAMNVVWSKEGKNPGETDNSPVASASCLKVGRPVGTKSKVPKPQV